VTRNLITTVNSRIELPPDLPRGVLADIRKAFTHSDPRYGRKRGAGYSTFGQSSVLKTYETHSDGSISVPRGGASRLRAIARRYGMVLRMRDARTTAAVRLPPYGGPPLRPYQAAAVSAAMRRQQGIIRAPTGSGKSLSAVALISEIGERAMILMSSLGLAAQWSRVVQSSLGLRPSEVGMIGGRNKYRPGCPVVISTVQSLTKDDCQRLKSLLADETFGALIVDECQTVAANTFRSVVDLVPAKYRIGFSADETRRDRMEFLIYDIMGDPIYEVDRKGLIEAGVIHAVDMRAVPTAFEADWYVNAEPADRNFMQLLAEMVECEDRNGQLLSVIDGMLAAGELPAMVFTHRREHASELVAMLDSRGIRAATVLGGGGVEKGLDQLRNGEVQLGVGTYSAMGTGIDIPAIRAGLSATPISAKNPQFFNQVRGRMCRIAGGKDSASIYYLWDAAVFPRQLGVLEKWNDDRVTVLRDGEWIASRDWC